MEQCSIVAHGSASFLKERLFDMSDKFKVLVCNGCGSIAASTSGCALCKDRNLEWMNIPYSCKLLFQELMACGIKIQIRS